MKNSQNLSRRQFIKGAGAGFLLWQIPFWQSCQKPLFKGSLSAHDQQIINSVLQILFPSQPGPGIYDIKAEYHLNNFLTDPLIDPAEQVFIRNGIRWTDETSREKFQKNYLNLSNAEQSKLIYYLLHESWGESWVSKLLSIVFEAMLLDPVYGINTHEIGWKYVKHIPGKPRPSFHNKYPDILNRKKENTVINNLNQL